MALDEATQGFLRGMADSTPPGTPPMWEMTAEQARAASAGLKNLYGAGPDMHRVEDHEIEAIDGGSFRARILVPSGAPDAVLVYYHGGGWVLDGLDGYDTLGRQLAMKSGAAVVLVEYRKAPEHPFPVPVEDAWAGLEWTAGRIDSIAGSPVPLFVAGDSAGGNLAAIVTHRARDRQGPEIAGQVLVYPATDADLGRASYLEPENQSFLTTEFMAWFWNHYLPQEAERTHPEASPLRAASLASLPPALVLTAEHDVLRDEGEEYAQRLVEAGVPVVHRRWEGQMHAFFTMVNILPASAEAIDLVAGHVRERAAEAQAALAP
ncbi:alpha/beta hydrolase [Paeniglutamicibacter sp. MACA_103]|uniref:alpha/beta hydrolase n=1 Tax=Paeniglutamicibacter sp. MACA_103 TaxID=3377337 RepID=UPI003892DC7C